MHTKSKRGFSLVELVVVVALLAIGLGVVTTALISGVNAYNKISVQSQDRQVASIISQEIENELRFSNAVLLFDPATQSAPADHNVIKTINGLVHIINADTSSQLMSGQTDLPTTYVVSLSFSQTTLSAVDLTVTVSDTGRDLDTFPPFETTTSMYIFNLPGESGGISLLPTDGNTFSEAAFTLP